MNCKNRFCVNCGQEIPCDSRFCLECGAVQDESSIKINRNITFWENENLDKRNKIFALVAVCAIALCIIIGILSMFIKPSINLNKYLTVTFEGYEGYGKATVRLDTEQFEQDYGEKLNKINDETNADYYGVVQHIFSSYVAGELDKTSGLSNGDVTTFTWQCDDKTILERYGYKLKYKDKQYTVEGLEEAETFDAFTGIEVVFEGVSPHGYASVLAKTENEEVGGLYYDIEPNGNLANGDQVKVVVSSYYEDIAEYCMEQCGKVPETTEKIFEVKGLNSYVVSLEEISDEGLEEMKKHAEKIFNNRVVSFWDKEETLIDFTYLGNYLLTKKETEDDSGYNENKLCLVYKMQVKNVYSANGKKYNKTNDVYWYLAYDEVLINEKGVITFDENDYDTPRERVQIDSGISRGWFGTKSWYYYGYASLNELYEDFVIGQEDIYQSSSSIDKELLQ